LLAVRVMQLSYLSSSGVQKRQRSVREIHLMQLLLMRVGPTHITDIVEEVWGNDINTLDWYPVLQAG
jgi:hypothetical protein